MRPEDACIIAVQILSALGAAHRAGIVHRDVKPANVFVIQTPLTSVFVKLLDFGVAKLLTPQAGPALTSFDDVIGSAPYMAPEQIRGEEIDARTDIFAVGVTLYEMLAGRRPFVAAANENVMVSILRGGPIAPLAVPRALEAIVLRAITRAPSARYLTADEMAAALLPFIPQASLGAVATTAMESRTAPGRTWAEQATGTSTSTSTRADSGTRGAPPPTVGPPTYAPPTLANTLDHPARSDQGQPQFGPSPTAPTWSAPAAISPPYYGGAQPARPALHALPARRAWLLIPVALLLLPFFLSVAIRAASGGAGALGGSGPSLLGGAVGRAPLSVSCMHRFPDGKPNLCQDFFIPSNSPVAGTDFCGDSDGTTRSKVKCDRTGAKFGCDAGTVVTWMYAFPGNPKSACPTPGILLTP